jgi:hypothetical protein
LGWRGWRLRLGRGRWLLLREARFDGLLQVVLPLAICFLHVCLEINAGATVWTEYIWVVWAVENGADAFVVPYVTARGDKERLPWLSPLV